MKPRLTFFLIIFLFLNSLVNAQTIETKFQDALDSIYTANPKSVGIMVHVESPAKGISWSGASGYSNKNTEAEVEPVQPALIASNIKPYVSATILKLVEEDKVSIHQSIKELITAKTKVLFQNGGYNLDSIAVKHLLSHTSGIQNYATQGYIDFISANKTYRWTRDEQLELTIKQGPPLGKPGSVFNYSDANYLLLTEIIEGIVKKPFHTAMRELLSYESLGLTDTWMPTLEDKPTDTKPLVHQYWSEYDWDSYDIDISVDLYGGGGIACTTHDLAIFTHKLFNAEVIKDTSVFNLIYTKIQTNDSTESNYYLGISSSEYGGYKSYGHSGFWGTAVEFFSKINTTISVFVLDRDQRKLRPEIINRVLEILSD